MNWFHWALLSALFAGITAVLAKIGVSGIDSNLATAIRTTVVLAFTWMLAFLTWKPGASLAQLPAKTWLFLALSGIATGLSWTCYFKALQIGDASRVAPVDKLSVVFAILLAALFLKERLGWQHALGGALIAAGAIVLTVGGKPA
jgi:bacterial/archaeal transporter family protein